VRTQCTIRKDVRRARSKDERGADSRIRLDDCGSLGWSSSGKGRCEAVCGRSIDGDVPNTVLLISNTAMPISKQRKDVSFEAECMRQGQSKRKGEGRTLGKGQKMFRWWSRARPKKQPRRQWSRRNQKRQVQSWRHTQQCITNNQERARMKSVSSQTPRLDTTDRRSTGRKA
jgi:hypothetical protein